MKRLGSILFCSFFAASCSVGPDYHEPSIPTPNSYRALPPNNAPLSTPTADTADLSQWWMQFGDAELQGLIKRALASNLDLLTTELRIREAREGEIEAGAAGLPQVNANAFAAHLHSNSNLATKLAPPSGSGGPPPGATDLKLYSLGFDATWEIDVFGGLRRSVEAARANTEATVWQMRDGEVSLTAEIATDYLTLRALQARIAILRGEVDRQRDTLALISARAHAGLVTQLDVNQQSNLVATTQAQLPQLETQARAMEHAIAVLMGEQPESAIDELDRTAALPAIPEEIPAGLPSELLRRRPDVREAERKLAAATAQVGVAVADLYPKFNLIGGASFTGNHLSNLLSNGNLGEFGLGSIMWPIFHSGQGQANVHAKEEEENQAYYAYRKAVLGAIRDAEDALTRYTSEQRRLQSLEQSVAVGKSSAELSLQQYRAGLTDYTRVLTAQNNYLTAQDQIEQSRQAFATDLVSLYKALGGGWNSTEPLAETSRRESGS